MTKTLLFSATLLVSSALVFLVEFTCAKMVLPPLGGTPAVWNTCLVFFQAGLLLGYAYAHFAPSRLGVGRHALVHLALWGLACCFLFVMPMNVATAGRPPGEPIFWLLRFLAISIGFPFVLLSSCGPLLQRWFANAASSAANPYFLYTASNLGSMLGLFLYPFVIEPNLSLAEQNQVWTWVFVSLAGLLTACVISSPWPVARGKLPATSAPITEHSSRTAAVPVTNSLRLRWVLLALVPSSLMLSVTSYLTTDIAPIPLLWMLPMAIYLGSFVLVFSWHNYQVQASLARWLPAVVLLVAVVPLAEGTEPILLIMSIHLLAFLWIAVVCHSELARSKPPARDLTEFYLWLAVGGVLGGMCNALAAPLIFNSIVEYPLMLVLAGWLNPGEDNVRANRPSELERPTDRFDVIMPVFVGLMTLGLVFAVGAVMPADRLSAALMFFPPALVCLLTAAYPARFSLCLAALLLASSFYGGVHGKPIFKIRSFFGVHRVTQVPSTRPEYHLLIHGNTTHGMQSLDRERRREPLTYFHRDGPIGKFFTHLAEKKDPRLKNVAIIGLGTGALSCYAEKGQRWTFFEIDPAVKRIATDPKLFTFLKDSENEIEAPIDIILGDARLSLQDSEEKFGVLVIDAFGSDSIPLHLLTREALAIYRQRLQPGGILAFHISNRYFHLEPILANLASEVGWECKIREDGLQDKAAGKYPSTWVLMAENVADLSEMKLWPDARRDERLRPWTDDFSNVLQILK